MIYGDTPPHLWVDGWVNGGGLISNPKNQINWPNQDHSILDIVDIFGHFYLNHLSLLQGYLFLFWLTALWLMADWIILDIGWVVDKACVYAMKGQW